MADKSNDQERLLEHDYDGIQEYDNPLPRWWLWIFYATIVYVPIYYFAPAPFGEGDGVVAEYETAVAANLAAQPPVTTLLVSDDALTAQAANPAVIAEGKKVYDQYCAVCHRLDGGGLIGPNLTDNAWIHGGTPTAIHRTIAEGVLAKGMPAWSRVLQPKQVDAVSAYVITLKGTNPPSPKAPEGAPDPVTPVGERTGGG